MRCGEGRRWQRDGDGRAENEVSVFGRGAVNKEFGAGTDEERGALRGMWRIGMARVVVAGEVNTESGIVGGKEEESSIIVVEMDKVEAKEFVHGGGDSVGGDKARKGIVNKA